MAGRLGSIIRELERQHELEEIENRQRAAERWEQRRYEIAKDIYTSYFVGSHISGYSTTEAEAAKRAIHAADTLLEELKPKQ